MKPARDWPLFKSGSYKQHGLWHDVMWDIHTRIQDEKMTEQPENNDRNVQEIGEETEVGGFVTETPVVLERT